MSRKIRRTDVLYHDCMVPADIPRVVWARESFRTQSNPEFQARYIADRLWARGRFVIGQFWAYASGKKRDPDTWEEFRLACSFAIEHDAIIVVRDWTRALRHERWKSDGPERDLLPTTEDWKFFKEMSQDVIVASLWDLDLDTNAIHGRAAKFAKKQRRERKQDRRAVLQPVALRLRQSGYSIPRISKLLKTPRSNIQRWIVETP